MILFSTRVSLILQIPKTIINELKIMIRRLGFDSLHLEVLEVEDEPNDSHHILQIRPKDQDLGFLHPSITMPWPIHDHNMVIVYAYYIQMMEPCHGELCHQVVVNQNSLKPLKLEMFNSKSNT